MIIEIFNKFAIKIKFGKIQHGGITWNYYSYILDYLPGLLFGIMIICMAIGGFLSILGS